MNYQLSDKNTKIAWFVIVPIILISSLLSRGYLIFWLGSTFLAGIITSIGGY